MKQYVVKARKVWEITQRTFRGANVLAMLRLYNSLVVPLLEYASPVWSPHTKRDTQKCELVQRHVTLKAILGYQNMDYETQLLVLGLVSLEEHRRTKDLVTCYKCINGSTDVDTHYLSPSLCTRSSYNQKLQIQFCHTITVLIVLCLHGIAFLILLFLLRILSCLENICHCITV